MIVPLPTYFAAPARALRAAVDEDGPLDSEGGPVPRQLRLAVCRRAAVGGAGEIERGSPRIGALVDRVVRGPAHGVESRRRGGGARRFRAEACVEVPEAHVARAWRGRHRRRVRRAVCRRRPGDGVAAGERRSREEAGRDHVVVDDAPDLVGVPPDAGVGGRVVLRSALVHDVDLGEVVGRIGRAVDVADLVLGVHERQVVPDRDPVRTRGKGERRRDRLGDRRTCSRG